MSEREALSTEFCKNILAPHEESFFVSDEATLFDVSLAPEDELIEKIRLYYGCSVTRVDLQRHFWVLLDQLNACRIKENKQHQLHPQIPFGNDSQWSSIATSGNAARAGEDESI